jgi:hypothetical protein
MTAAGVLSGDGVLTAKGTVLVSMVLSGDGDLAWQVLPPKDITISAALAPPRWSGALEAPRWQANLEGPP